MVVRKPYRDSYAVGAIETVPTAMATARYQEVVVLALAACHAASAPAPAGFLKQLAAKAADEGLPPRPSYVLATLVRELGARGTTNPYAARDGFTARRATAIRSEGGF